LSLSELFPQSFVAIQTDNSVLSPGGLVLGCAASILSGKMFLERFDAIKVGKIALSSDHAATPRSRL
jgi:hypothetical protein